MKSTEILGLVHNITEKEAIEYTQKIQRQNDGFISIGFLNQHGFNLIASNSDTELYFSKITLLLRDGIGIKLANKLLGIQNSDNLNGTDLIPLIVDSIDYEANYFVFGTESPWLEKGAENLLTDRNYKMLDGFKEHKDYLDFLQHNIEPTVKNVIILAMGMPKQEQLAYEIQKNIQGSGIIICGGAIIDFKAGKVKRAPKIFRTLSLEWLYRLMNEPRRLFKRYVIGIPFFFFQLIKKK